MKKRLLQLVLICSISLKTIAQVGIGIATPDASAQLHIESTSRGILIPRTSTTANITTPANGLLVYQTGGIAGFYYNSGTSTAPNWVMLGAGGGTLSPGSVTTTEIADNTITGADISTTAAIPYTKLSLTNSVSNSDLIANSVTTSKVANGTVTTSKMADSAISGLKLLTYAVVADRHISSLRASAGQVIGFNGTNVGWVTPSWVEGAVQVFDASSCSPCNFTVTDVTVRSIFIDGAQAGTTARNFSGVTINLTIPAASAYNNGSILNINVNNYSVAPASLNITSPSSTIAAVGSSSANLNMSSGVQITSTGGRLVGFGTSNKWFRAVN